MTFEEHARDGNVYGAIRNATTFSALWAIGSSWASAVHEISRLLLPDDIVDRVFAEILSATVTTVLGVGISIFAMRVGRSEKAHPIAPAQVQMRAPSQAVRALRQQ